MLKVEMLMKGLIKTIKKDNAKSERFNMEILKELIKTDSLPFEKELLHAVVSQSIR